MCNILDEGCFTTHNMDRLLPVEWDLLKFLMYGIYHDKLCVFFNKTVEVPTYLHNIVWRMSVIELSCCNVSTSSFILCS